MVFIRYLAFFCIIASTAIAQEPRTLTLQQSTEQGVLVTQDGTSITLAGLYIPNPLKAHDFLNRFTNEQATIRLGKQETDRHGNLLAQVDTPQGNLQQMLVETGLAFVYPTADNDLDSAKLYTVETKARMAKKGLWAQEENSIYQASDTNALLAATDQFRIVEGTVTGVKHTPERSYINFGLNWKNDFTLVIPSQNKRLFKGKILDTLVGKKVRARGWVESFNGPAIALFCPGQWEIVN